MNDNMAMMGLPGLVPFGIMAGEAGRWMVGYQFMFDDMSGSLVGTQEISDSQILKEFPAAPTDMTMQMHMAMLMYAPTDKLTLSAMVPYVWKEMNNITAAGGRFVERADGIGDVQLRGSYCVYDSKDSRHRLLLNGGVGLPSGSIDATMDGMPWNTACRSDRAHFLSCPESRILVKLRLGDGVRILIPSCASVEMGMAIDWATLIQPAVGLRGS